MQQIVARDVPLLHLYYTIPFVAFRKAVFTQWSYDRGAGPYNKQLFVTGTNRGGLTVRPIKEGA